jgi:hypothetical protein
MLKHLTVAAGLAVLVAGMASAQDLRLRAGGANTGESGSVVIELLPAGKNITAAQIFIQFDAATMAIANAAANFTPAAGWVRNDFNVVGNQAIVAMTNTDGQNTQGPLLTITAQQNATGVTSGEVTLTAESNLGDDEFESYYLPGPRSAPFLTGPVRNLDGTANNAVSVGIVNGQPRAAVAAGQRLYLLDANTMADVATWPANGFNMGDGTTVSGRPVFATVGAAPGVPVVGVITDQGRAFVLNAETGAVVADINYATVTGAPTAPAVVGTGENVDVYVAGNTATGPVLAHARGNTPSAPVSLGGAAVQVLSSPAVVGGRLIVGTSESLWVFMIEADGSVAPTGTAITTGDFATSPVVLTDTGTALVGANSGANGNVVEINYATSAQVGTTLQLAGAAPLSDPFAVRNEATNTMRAAFGGGNGQIYEVLPGPAAGPAHNFGTSRVFTPLIVGANIYAGDAEGRIGRPGAVNIDLPSSAGRALAATGTNMATDRLIGNTVNGSVFSLPLQ